MLQCQIVFTPFSSQSWRRLVIPSCFHALQNVYAIYKCRSLVWIQTLATGHQCEPEFCVSKIRILHGLIASERFLFDY